MSRLENLQQQLMTLLGEQTKLKLSTDEITLEVSPDHWQSVCQRLRDEPALRFETCIDLCGLDSQAISNTSLTHVAAADAKGRMFSKTRIRIRLFFL